MLSSELDALLIYGLAMALVLLLKVSGMLVSIDMAYLLSSRDENRTLEGMLGRMDRALNNSVVAMALFAPAVVVLALRDQSSAESLLASQAFVVARIVYFPAYMFGIRGFRTLVWTIGFFATVVLYFLAL